MNKYNFFYEDIKGFTTALKWTNDASFIGVSEKEIKDFEELRGVKLGEGFSSYLKHFGRKIDTKFLSINYGFERMKEVEEIEEEMNEDLEIGEEKVCWAKEISKVEKQSIGYCKDNVPILIGHIIENGVVLYTSSNEEDFYITDFNVDLFQIGIKTPFTTVVRRSLYFALTQKPIYNVVSKNKYNKHFDEFLVSKIPWLDFYKELMKRKLCIPRDQFYNLALKRELKENRIMGIDEFEVECIKYLIEKEGITPMPEIFDPYAPLVTFREYLKEKS